jgi:hypothetical protein
VSVVGAWAAVAVPVPVHGGIVRYIRYDEFASELTNCLSVDEFASELTNCLSVDEFASELTNCLSVDEFASESVDDSPVS